MLEEISRECAEKLKLFDKRMDDAMFLFKQKC